MVAPPRTVVHLAYTYRGTPIKTRCGHWRGHYSVSDDPELVTCRVCLRNKDKEWAPRGS